MRPPERRRRIGGADGSVLLLFPTAVRVVLLLGAITVDSANLFLAERELLNAVAGAANDAATMALGDAAYYREGDLRYDGAALRALVSQRLLAGLDEQRHHDLQFDARVVPAPGGTCRPSVRVSASSRIDAIFAGVVPGGGQPSPVEAVSEARVEEGTADGC